MRVTISMVAPSRAGGPELPLVGSAYPVGEDAEGSIPGTVVATEPTSDRTGQIELEVAAEHMVRFIEYTNR